MTSGREDGDRPLAADLRDVIDLLRARAAAALEQARRAEAFSVHQYDQIQAKMAELHARLHCAHCVGDLDRPDWYLTIGEGPCTCLVRCPAKTWCNAADPPGAAP